ncbi:MAG: helix-turn-helix domain-containing protein [Candidatus Saccharibacteria bacterium]|nr:helix-turn-helix domain-containing protein [Candidatus Saccharibacteria bacterium]
MLSEKVNEIKASTPVKAEPDSELTDLSCAPESKVKTIKQKQKHKFSNKEIREMVAAYKNGVSTYGLADKFGCHRSTIASQLRKQGVKVSIEKIDMDDAIALYESGWTTKRIAEKYHMSDNAVSRRLKLAGVKMRARWDYPEMPNNHSRDKY